MTADEARDLLSDAIEGTLPEAQRAELDALMEKDEELRSEYEALRMVMRGAGSIAVSDDEQPAPDLLRGVQERIRRRSKGRYYRDRFSRESGGRHSMTLLIAILIALLIAASWVAVQNLVVIER